LPRGGAAPGVFKRAYNLADYVEVKGATFEGGLLKIALVRDVPEAMKPRQIAIHTGNGDQQIEHKKAA
jgi:molecular chaperone IbpA